MTAATWASVASWTIVIGRNDGSLRWRSTVSRTSASSDAEHVGDQADRAIQVLRVLADDRDAVGMAVADEDRIVAIVDHAPRRPQRESPLMVVLGHLLVGLVLHDLQHPEAHRQHGEHGDDEVLQDGQPQRWCAGDLRSSTWCLTVGGAHARHAAAPRRRAAAPRAETPRRRRSHCRAPARRPPRRTCRTGERSAPRTTP